MVKSMTGYGRARAQLHQRDITVELRSVNNRYLDCNIKMPRSYAFAEDAVKTAVQKSVSRGKVDVFISVESLGADEVVVTVNQNLASQYAQALRQLSAALELPCSMDALTVARFPEVLTLSKAEEDVETISADICQVLGEALDAYQAMRCREGEKLAEDILGRLSVIEDLTSHVESRSPETVREYREKLEARMQEVLQNTAIDPARILTEAAIFADKVAVDEETVRLRSHLTQLRDMLASCEPVGRKLDFLIQEVNRESNTIGSKCNDIEITKDVLNLKAEVEKIREQVQNIE